MIEETTVQFEGPLAEAYELVDGLRDAGIEVAWVPPPAERSDALEAIAIAIAARGGYDVILAVVRRVQDRLREGGRILVDRPDPDASDGEPTAGA